MSMDRSAEKTAENALPPSPGDKSNMQMQGIGRGLARAASFLLLLFSLSICAANEETFATLKIGDHTYQNVRVTTKSKNFIIILHSGGITSIKVSELPLGALQKLGYAPAPTPKQRIKTPTMLASLVVPKTDMEFIKRIKAKLTQAWQGTELGFKKHVSKPNPRLVVIAVAVLLVGYLFYSYCCVLICQKTGNEPGVWGWVPLLQAFPLLRAASMPAWWFAALFIPGLNLLGYALWCVRIVQAREKTMPWTILLLFPLTTG